MLVAFVGSGCARDRLESGTQCNGAARLLKGTGCAWITLEGDEPAPICCTQHSADCACSHRVACRLATRFWS